MSHVHIHDAKTGDSTTRDMTADELAQHEADIAAEQAEADAKEAEETARQSAIDKLAALGLTVDEISAAFGLAGN